ncbi:TPA: PIN-like domain-containing protein [Bacillus pacificus]
MKSKFKGFYKPDEEEFKDIWDSCIFIFDTNILLNVYRYPTQARDTLITVFETLNERIWIPHQVGLEYNFRMIEEIKDQEQAYDRLKNKLAAKFNEISDEYKNASLRHSNLKLDETLLDEVKVSIEKIKDDLKIQKETHPDLHTIQLKLHNIFDGKVGESFDQEKIDEIQEAGTFRYEMKIPPGWKDKSKNEKRYHDGFLYETKYGDFIAWNQILEYAKDNQTNVLFITDDQKEDWWKEYKGETIGPQPELIQEFKRYTNGCKFYMYQAKQFLKFISKYITTDLSSEHFEKAIEDIDNYKKYVEEQNKIDDTENAYKFIKEKENDKKIRFDSKSNQTFDLDTFYKNHDFRNVEPLDLYEFLSHKYEKGELFTMGDIKEELDLYLIIRGFLPIGHSELRELLQKLTRNNLVSDEDTGTIWYWALK